MNSALQSRPVPEKLKEISKKYAPLKNCEDLIAGELNSEMLGIVKRKFSLEKEREFRETHESIMCGMAIMARGMHEAYVVSENTRREAWASSRHSITSFRHRSVFVSELRNPLRSSFIIYATCAVDAILAIV